MGANKNNASVYDYKDNIGKDNISDKNYSFCELTGLYWIWKNSKQDIVGLEHYRRYFAKKKKIITPKFLSEQDIKNILLGCDMILPEKKKFDGYSCKEQFIKWHKQEVWDACSSLIHKKYPEYVKAFEQLEESKCGYAYNMFIASKNIIDQYCEWLFDILFELESKIDVLKYDRYNHRMWGFLSERLLNVWILKNNIKVYENKIMFIDEIPWYKKYVDIFMWKVFRK